MDVSEANKVYATVSDGIHTCACLNPVILAFARHLITLSGHVSCLFRFEEPCGSS